MFRSYKGRYMWWLVLDGRWAFGCACGRLSWMCWLRSEDPPTVDGIILWLGSCTVKWRKQPEDLCAFITLCYWWWTWCGPQLQIQLLQAPAISASPPWSVDQNKPFLLQVAFVGEFWHSNRKRNSDSMLLKYCPVVITIFIVSNITPYYWYHGCEELYWNMFKANI